MVYVPVDYYAREANRLGYVSRAVFKLMEMDRKYGLLKRGMHVLDLGSSPGSWVQYAAERIGPAGRITCIDRHPAKVTLENAVFMQGDVRHHVGELSLLEKDVVLSDMAPDTTGHTDHWRSVELCMFAVAVAHNADALVCKVLSGPDDRSVLDNARAYFSDVFLFRPKATRRGSRELYVVGRR
ncbi:MAG: RlmE family RNA methyltransferase [Nanoarchaeota archaeon]